MIRIGVTMGGTTACGYAEERDALAREWAHFLACAIPECLWMPVPNLGDSVADFADAWDLSGLILTGGDDLGNDPVRDASETALLDRALSRGNPVLGICRGFQLIQNFLGGSVESCGEGLHVATRHTVSFTSTAPVDALCGTTTKVNSFHRYGIRAGCLASGLKAFAYSDDGIVEGAAARGHRLLGLMWHPERESHSLTHDIALVRELFGHPDVSPSAMKPCSVDRHGACI